MNKKPEELVGRKCYELLHKMDKPWYSCPMEKTRSDLTSHVEEVDDPNIGIPLLVTTSPILDANGNFAGSVHIAKDITDIRRREKTIREAESKYKAIFTASKDAMMILKPGNGFIDGTR